MVLAGLRFETCLIYLDDIIVYGKTFEEELKRLEEVFVRFQTETKQMCTVPEACYVLGPYCV